MFVGLIPARAGKTAHSSSRRASTRAHPRAGGENSPVGLASWCQLGSSPRGRGKPGVEIGDHSAHRLIPARAGKTPSTPDQKFSTTAHPRAGGENCADMWEMWAAWGSSPRGRGKRNDELRSVGALGLIPARAGKTRAASIVASRTWAHPRAGGENAYSKTAATIYNGSSPRGRGKLVDETNTLHTAGLIPARAGKTPSACPWPCLRAAHPRAGGENRPCKRPA